jgi:hypothetical protein
MNGNADKPGRKSSESIIIKSANVILFIICAGMVYFLFLMPDHIVQRLSWYDIAILAAFIVPLFLRRKNRENQSFFNDFEWKTMPRSKRIFTVVFITFWICVLSFVIYFGILWPILAGGQF